MGIFHVVLLFANFFQNQLFRKTVSGIPSDCQTIWIQIRPKVLPSLIWVQTVCKSYQQMTLVGKEGNFACCFIILDFFSKLIFLKILSGISSVSNSLDLNQALHFPGHDLGPNYLQNYQHVTGKKTINSLQGSSWAMTVGRIDFSLQEN